MSSESFTFFIVSSSKCVILSVNLCLSIVRICSSKMTESLSNPCVAASISTWVGNFAFWICAVIAATMAVGLNRFPMSFWMISTGLTPPCSDPTTGERSAKKTSPRFTINVYTPLTRRSRVMSASSSAWNASEAMDKLIFAISI